MPVAEGGKTVAMPTAIEAEGLVKRFGNNTALAGVDLAAEEGTVLGLLGPHGAGKTTMVKMLSTLAFRPDGGLMRLFMATTSSGSPAKCVHLIGLTGQDASVDEDISRLGESVSRAACC